MVEAVGGSGDAVAADEFQAGRRHRNAERHREFVAVLGQRTAGIDREFVGERRQCRQDAGAAHDDAVLGVADLAQDDVVLLARDLVLRLVDRRMDQRVGQADVVPAQEFLVFDLARGARLVAVLRPFVRAAGEPGIGDVHVVRRAPHHADGVFRDAAQAAMPPLHVVRRARDHVADIDQLAGLRVREQAVVGGLVLQVEDRGHALGGARERRVRHDVGDAVVADPDLAIVLQSAQQFRARASRHFASPRLSYAAQAMPLALAAFPPQVESHSASHRGQGNRPPRPKRLVLRRATA